MTSPDLVLVYRASWRVRYVETTDDPAAIRACWDQLEGLLPSFRGRKFAGFFDAEAGWYRASVRTIDDPSEAESSLPVAVLSGGSYLRYRMRGEPPALYDRLPGAFDALLATGRHDPSRPSIELYRSHGLLDALLPVQW